MTPRRFSVQYVDGLLGSPDPSVLAQLSSLVTSSSEHDPTKPHAGLPAAIFAFVQTLTWLSQSLRSGVWTYYEATPPDTQRQLLAVLDHSAPLDLSAAYRDGMRLWRAPMKANSVDEWISRNDVRVRNWLRDLAMRERDGIQRLA